MLRLRDVFSAAIGAEETRIEASFSGSHQNRRELNKIGSRLGAVAQRGHRYLDRVSRVIFGRLVGRMSAYPLTAAE